MRFQAEFNEDRLLGPTLWNVLEHSVLRLNLPENCNKVAYAENLELLVEADYKATYV